MEQLLTGFAAMLGIPSDKLPTPEVMLATIGAMARNFGNMHKEEVRTAFEMAATGRLDCEEHYQTLSLKYISSVLNSYRVKVNQAIRQYERDRIEPPTEHKEADWTETLEDLKKDPSLPIPAAIYDWMVKKELIKPTGAEKVAAMRQADLEHRQALQKKIMAGYGSAEDKAELEQMHKGYGRKSAVYTKVANEAKRILVKKYLQVG